MYVENLVKIAQNTEIFSNFWVWKLDEITVFHTVKLSDASNFFSDKVIICDKNEDVS